MVEHDPVRLQEVLNGGRVRIRLTHPNLWRSLMVYAVTSILLGLNFAVLHPTFLIYGTSNYVWAVGFLAVGISTLVFANIKPNLRLVRIGMSCDLAYTLFIALGTVEPFLHGKGSLQLPIVYVALAALKMPMLMEPFINPLMAKRVAE